MVMAPSAIDIDFKETTILNDSKIDLFDKNHGFESDVTGFASKTLIQKVLKEQVARINTDTCEAGEEDAFYVADLGEVYRQHLRWKMNLGRVKPFYGEFTPQVVCLRARLIIISGEMQPRQGSSPSAGKSGDWLRLCVQG